MAGYLLDTNHASPLVTPGHSIRERIIESMADGDVFYLTPLVITETVFGFSILPRAQQNRNEWDILRPALRILDMDEQDALDAAALQVTQRRQGRQLATIDALIATVALRYNVVLLTTDRDFRFVPGLRTENWVLVR